MEFCGRKQSYKKKSNKKGEKTETKRCEGLICAGKKEKRGRCGYQTYLWINQEFMSPATGFHATIWPWPCVWPYACMPPWLRTKPPWSTFFLGGYIHFILVYLNIIFFSCCPCHVATLAPCLPPPPNFPHHAHLLNLKFPIFEHLFSLSIVACLFWGIMIACASFSFQS